MKLKEFAEKVGLSPTTVSRALGGYPEVREETRQRVMEAALKYGYRPNANAVRLATGRAGAIGDGPFGRRTFLFGIHGGHGDPSGTGRNRHSRQRHRRQ
ncbi:transcriptional regulator with XRE-family HTH domain [Agrobacterium tumefaciens]|nr:transcriptional regulator with XRE-family HTH domain [Agrobacterium radiobacter]MBB4452346.1 transcriptional regulator with XRE-family HTH domain [Agrobacterium radiobacter]